MRRALSLALVGCHTLMVAAWRAWLTTRAAATRPVRARHRHLMIVSWTFAPIASVGVQMPLAFARYAVEAGWQVTVLCGPEPDRRTEAGEELLRSLPAGVRLRRVSGLLARPSHVRLRPARWSIRDIDGSHLTALAMLSVGLRLPSAERPSAILATGPRFSNFTAGRWLARAFGVPLALHYRDEWTVRTPGFVQATADDKVEETSCIAAAQLIFFASAAKQMAYRAAFPSLGNVPTTVLWNGWDPYHAALAGQSTRHLAPWAGRMTLVYTGRWHASLQPVLETFDAMLAAAPDWTSRLAIIFVGDPGKENADRLDAFARRHPGQLAVLPPVSMSTSVEIQREATVLLLINAHAYDGVVPQKTFDYLSSRRPILVLGAGGGATSIVKQLGAGRIVNVGDHLGLADALHALSTTPSQHFDTEARHDWVTATNRRTLILEALDRIAEIDTASERFGTSASLAQTEERAGQTP